MFHQCLSLPVGRRVRGDPCGIFPDVPGVFAPLDDLSVPSGGSAAAAHRAVFAGLCLVLLKAVACFVPTSVARQDLSLWTGIAVGVPVVAKMLHVVCGVGRLAFASDCGYGHQSGYAQVACGLELTTGMVSLVVEGGKSVRSQDGLGTSQHPAHGLFVVPVGDLVIDQQPVVRPRWSGRCSIPRLSSRVRSGGGCPGRWWSAAGFQWRCPT